MKKRIVSSLLALAVLISVLTGAFPARAESAPAIALYLNSDHGEWYAAKTLSGSGETWVQIPIEKSKLVENRENYLRLTTNVANGDTPETQARLFFTDSTWSNSFLSTDRNVDGGWSAYSDRQANFYIAGWNGSGWQRIHDDIDTGYRTDHAEIVGRNADGSYTNYARNIWIGSDTLDKYTNFCVMIHLDLGENRTTHSENGALFPAENFHGCVLCSVCGGCKDAACALGHVPCRALENGHHCAFCPVCGKCLDTDCGCDHEKCRGESAIRLRLQGQWYGVYIDAGKGTDGQWVSVPVSMEGLKAGETYQLSASSNLVSGGDYADNSVDFYATEASDGLESFLTNDRWCDGGWNGYTDRNVNLKLEGWNGHEWVDLNAAKPAYAQDRHTVLGQFSDGTWYNPCRNILLGDLTGIEAVRASVQVHIGKDLTPQSDYREENFAVFPGSQTVTEHPACPQHPDSCTVVGCPYHTCGEKHHCAFCDVCGKCTDGDCGCDHEKCSMDAHAALRVRVNGAWYGMYIADQTGDQWAYAPVDITKLEQNAVNQIALSSNVRALGDYGEHSVDVYMTETANGNSYLTHSRYCDEGWMDLTGRNVNMTLEFYDGEKWVPAVEEEFRAERHTVVGLFAPEDRWYNFCRNVSLGDLSRYSAARVAVQVHVGQRLTILDDYEEETFATFLSTGLASAGPVSDLTHFVFVHRLAPMAPAAADADRTEGRENVHLRVRLNGTWYETSLDGIRTDGSGMAWVPVEAPAEALRSGGENQILITSDAEAGSAYSGSSVDIYATGRLGADSYCNVNDYYDDWTRAQDAEWNIRLEASPDGENWETLTSTSPTYCDGVYQLGLRSDGSRSHAARNLFLGDTEGYRYARLWVQVHIGTHLGQKPALPPEPGQAQHSGNGGTPLLYVRVNGQWQSVDLTDYLGTNGRWVTCPIDLSRLNAGQENYFALTTNVVSYGEFTDSSVDFYATSAAGELNSFLTHDPYSDNDFARYEDRNINLVLELFDGTNWISVPTGERYGYDAHTVLGQFADGTWYNAARNLVLGDLSGYRAARLRVQMHVGSSLTVQTTTQDTGEKPPVSHHADLPEENAAVREIRDSQDVKLRVRVNGTWFETSLQPYKGRKAVWVPVEIDLGTLRAGEENYFNVSTTAVSYGKYTANSVDLFYTNSNGDQNSFLCRDEYCDNGWTRCEGYNVNLRLELFDGTNWVTAAPEETTYYDGSVPIGYLGDEKDWSNAARNLVIGGLTGYTAARVVVELHVGSAVAGLDDAVDGTTETESFDRSAKVGIPEYAPVKTAPAQPETPAEQSDKTMAPAIGIGAAALAVLAAAVLLFGRKKRKK